MMKLCRRVLKPGIYPGVWCSRIHFWHFQEPIASTVPKYYSQLWCTAAPCTPSQRKFDFFTESGFRAIAESAYKQWAELT